jgi:bacteriocin-like protein
MGGCLNLTEKELELVEGGIWMGTGMGRRIEVWGGCQEREVGEN